MQLALHTRHGYRYFVQLPHSVDLSDGYSIYITMVYFMLHMCPALLSQGA